MKIRVLQQMTIGELQQAFRARYPELELAFFTKTPKDYAYSPVKHLIVDEKIPLERIEEKPHNAEVEIHSDMKIFDFKQLFENEFGLHVHVTCKHGHQLFETIRETEVSLLEFHTRAVSRLQKPHELPQTNYYDSRTEWYMG